ncbi:MAG: hypothetical protein WC650_01425 [Candidatus Doudnabacteria bacterium]
MKIRHWILIPILMGSLAILPGCTGYEILDVAFEIADDMFHLSGDDDGEGLTNHQEESAHTNPDDFDTDDDGLNDYQEVRIYKTDPNNPDTDGDGMMDGPEVYAGRNPLVPDNPSSDTTASRGGTEEEGATPQEEQADTPSAVSPPTPAESDPASEDTVSTASGHTYLNEACRFSFYYPSGWEIKSAEFYTMLDGTKADFPTVILGRSGSSTNDDIALNMRQAFCMTVEPYDKKTESAGTREVNIYTYYSADRKTKIGGCLEAEVEALNMKGKTMTYTFISQSNDSIVLSAFKEAVKTFKVIK